MFVVDNPNKALPDFNTRSNQILNNIIIKYDEVKRTLEKLNTNKSQGVDKLHPFILQKCSSTLAYPLTIIYKDSMETGKVPDAFFQANITPLFKKGSKVDPANYRPVSLTSVPCKILERIVGDQISPTYIKRIS